MRHTVSDGRVYGKFNGNEVMSKVALRFIQIECKCSQDSILHESLVDIQIIQVQIQIIDQIID